MRRAALVMAMVVLMPMRGGAAEIGCAPAFVSGSWSLLKLAAYGESSYERAAFVVRDGDGALRIVAWPWERRSLEASYHGVAPAGTVAIVHTHPNGTPLPSPGDQETAARLGIPVYVLTRSMVSRTDGADIATLWSGDWKPGRRSAALHSTCPAATFANVQ